MRTQQTSHLWLYPAISFRSNTRLLDEQTARSDRYSCKYIVGKLKNINSIIKVSLVYRTIHGTEHGTEIRDGTIGFQVFKSIFPLYDLVVAIMISNIPGSLKLDNPPITAPLSLAWATNALYVAVVKPKRLYPLWAAVWSKFYQQKVQQ